uniref:Uncharacterized protein n=1 Tax=Spongospora subterranea TaxID=70186 RepID=A0A0H5QV07_9EUKA|eukprot:CRZ05406.1 hypothetical protein [Spongospora subterranea]
MMKQSSLTIDPTILTAAASGFGAVSSLLSQDTALFIPIVSWLCDLDAVQCAEPVVCNVVRAVNECLGSIESVYLRKAIELIIDSFEQQKSSDVLRLLSPLILSSYDESDPNTDVYLKGIVSRLSRCSWSGCSLNPILSLMQEIKLDESMMAVVLAKFENEIIACDPLDIPSASHNLVLLCIKMPEYRLAILSTFTSSFQRVLSRFTGVVGHARSPILHALSIVIQDFGMSVRQDQELGGVFIKLVKTRKVALGSFSIAVLLSMVDLHRFRKPIWNFIISYIMGSYQCKTSTTNSKFMLWVVQQASKKQLIADGSIGLFKDADLILDELESDSRYGWDFYIPVLVDMAFLLLSQAQDKGRSSVPSCLYILPDDDINVRMLNPNVMTIRASLRLLTKIFVHQRSSRSAIIDKLLYNILNADNNGATPDTALSSDHNISPSMILLRALIGTDPKYFLEFTLKIRNSFDYIMSMDAYRASQLVESLVPVLSICSELHAGLVITLRKSLFSRRIDYRVMAIDGFLNLVRSQMPQMQSQSFFSQSSSSQFPTSPDAMFFIETQGLLHRALTQQAAVRKHLYSRLEQSFCQGSQTLREQILGLLSKHLDRMVERDAAVKLPFHLDNCIESGTIMEPLPSLFRCFCHCVLEDGKGDGNKESVAHSNDIVDIVLRKLSKCVLEDFAFDFRGDRRLSQLTPAEDDNVFRANLRLSSLFWLEIHDTLIHFIIATHPDLTSETLDQIFQLHKVYASLRTSAFTKVQAKRKGNNPGQASSTPDSRALHSFISILTAVHGKFSVEGGAYAIDIPDQTVRSKILSSTDFLRYVLVGADEAITFASRSVNTVAQRNSFLHDCCSIAPVLVRQCVHDLASATAASGANQSDKGPSLAALSLGLLCHCLDAVAVFGEQAVEQFIQSCMVHEIIKDMDCRQDERSSGLAEFVQMLEHMLLSSCSDNSVVLEEETSHLLSCIVSCSHFLQEKLETRLPWFSEACRYNVTVPSLAADLGAYGCSIFNFRECYDFLHRIAQDCVTVLGDVSEIMLATATSEMGFVSDQTVPALCARLHQIMEAEITVAEWLFSHIKLVDHGAVLAENSRALKPFPEPHSRSCEDCIFSLLHRSLQVTNELVSIKLKNHNSLKQTLSFLIRSFKLAVAATKLLLSGKVPVSRRFQGLATFIGSTLTPSVYSLFKFLQDTNGCPGESKSSTKEMIAGENRLLPPVIYQLEQFEHVCIKYFNMLKLPQLAEHFKRSTVFDFRFSVSKVLGKNAGEKKKHKKKRSRKEREEADDEQESEVLSQQGEENEENADEANDLISDTATLDDAHDTCDETEDE